MSDSGDLPTRRRGELSPTPARRSGLGGVVGVGKGDCVERAGSGGEGLCESPMEVEHLGALECRAGDEAVADGVAQLHVVKADNPGSNGVLAGIDPDVGGRIRGLKTSVDDELSVGGMDRSGKGRGENEKRVCFHVGLVFQIFDFNFCLHPLYRDTPVARPTKRKKV